MEIDEAALWDNLKRRANDILQKIENFETPEKRLNVFTKRRFAQIQTLLKGVGKEFFRIFLYKSLKAGIQNGVPIADTVRNFQFYFWPGYITLEGNRIFIEGSPRPNSTEERYFTGIGNKKMERIEENTFIQYFLKKENLPNLLTGSTDHWVYDIPSTIAFDSVMNQFYLDEDAKKQQSKFVAGSTHHWKSSQVMTIDEKTGKKKAMQMPLKKDTSEFRILEVRSDKQYTLPSMWNKSNKISISLPEKDVCFAGDVLARLLNADNIPVRFDDTQKKFYNPWPRITPAPENGDEAISHSDMFVLQQKACSFWIAETLAHDNDDPKRYFDIRHAFDTAGLEYLGRRIKNFNERLDDLEIDKKQRKNFSEIYYKAWYTIFLDSYGQSVDLGSGMLLTSDFFESDVLMQASHWIRWIFNELRLLEAQASKELQGQSKHFQEDFGKLAHNSKLLFPILRDRISNITEYDMDITKETVLSELSDLENIFKVSSYLNNLKKFNDLYDQEKISLNTMINNIIRQIEFDILHNEGEVIKLPQNKELHAVLVAGINNPAAPLFRLAFEDATEFFVKGHSGVIQVILKDIICNATRWCTSQKTPGTPEAAIHIRLSRMDGRIQFECTNNKFIDPHAVLIFMKGQIPADSTVSKSFGLMIANKYCEAFGIEKSVQTSQTDETTTFILKFESWIN